MVSCLPSNLPVRSDALGFSIRIANLFFAENPTLLDRLGRKMGLREIGLEPALTALGVLTYTVNGGLMSHIMGFSLLLGVVILAI